MGRTSQETKVSRSNQSEALGGLLERCTLVKSPPFWPLYGPLRGFMGLYGTSQIVLHALSRLRE